ncbi:MAG: TIM barrel protein [Isosphaeraceae bacterium]
MHNLTIVFAYLVLFSCGCLGAPPGTNPFYAMDTCTKRPYPRNDITPAQQLDLLKELGYAGIAWTEESPEAVRTVTAEAEARGLKMFAIYCSATVTSEGDLKPSAFVEPLIEVLGGQGTLIWLHIGGKGLEISSLTAGSTAIGRLRGLADKARQRGLSLAIYPHVGEWTERFGDAVRVARLVDRENFGVTFNLCHCLAMGDEARIPLLLDGGAHLLKSVTLNGADAGIRGPEWKRLIQTLDRGSFDVGGLLSRLRMLGYEGPIGLQGYGLQGDRRENLARSMDAWRRLSTAK